MTMPSTRGRDRVRPDVLDGSAFVAGDWVDGAESIPVEDPATGEIIGTVAALSIAGVDDAVAAAEAAFPAWRNRLPVDRGAILRRWAELMRAAASDLAVLMTLEKGEADVPAAIFQVITGDPELSSGASARPSRRFGWGTGSTPGPRSGR